ncbi:broad-complex core protein isoforms 1/2/3/4/5 isoform X2 [Drosophila persimilis]|uniref:broad-complex core protein isoforms 1/2/3/4/5 isoform X2 n=1 Tax=Drosophila persimilis TaxID=7234 RepID=UPI000F093C2A|nr:broad-complex core protein isoforms 1/2/3/4/5 isoform X2 [Drosophila persimilis]
MDDEFKLCWKNFQENIASGFQNLYDRGDLVDVTLACDGKLLQAHKIVLAICSPYFQEIFTSNPCRHPIIILKDVSFNIMLELLEFMYQGVVNVKHTELQSFMKIGQLLQIKGLATNSNSSPASSASEKSASQPPNHGQAEESSPSNAHNNSHSNSHHNSSNSANSTANNNSNNITNNSSSSSTSNSKSDADHCEAKGQSTQSNSRTTSPGGASRASSEASHLYALNKRPAPSDFSNDSLSIYSGKQQRRSMKEHTGGQHEGSSDTADNGAMLENPLNTEEFFLPPIPHISLGEPRYDLGGLKREQDGHHGPGGGGSSGSVGSLSSSASSSTAVNTLRNPFGPAFNLDYNFYKPSGNNSGGPSGSSNNSGPGSGGISNNGSSGLGLGPGSGPEYPNELYMPNDYSKNFANHMDIPSIAPGEHWFQGKLEFMLSQRGKPLLVHDGHTFGIQYVRKDKKYWQCNLSRKFNCKARVTTTDTGEIIVTNNEHCHTEIRQHLRKDYQRNKVMMNALINLSTNRFADLRRHNLAGLGALPMVPGAMSQGSPIDEVVQNLHDLAKASAEASQQQQRAHEAMKQDIDEPLDCGLRSSVALEEMARSFMANKPSIAFPGHESSGHNINDLAKDDSWKEKSEGDVH